MIGVIYQNPFSNKNETVKKTTMKSILLSVCTFIFASAVVANTIVVTNTLKAGPNSLRDAVANALSGDVIRFAPSLIATGIYFAKITSNGNVQTVRLIKE